jgi:hypothetical protein
VGVNPPVPNYCIRGGLTLNPWFDAHGAPKYAQKSNILQSSVLWAWLKAGQHISTLALMAESPEGRKLAGRFGQENNGAEGFPAQIFLPAR